MAGQAEKGTGKSGRKALWATVAVIAIAGAGMAGYKNVLEKSISEHIAERGGKAGSVSVDFLGRVHLRDVTLPLKNGSDVHVAAVDGRPKILFLNGMLELSGLDVEMELGKISVPHASVEEANFDRGTLAEMFGDKSDLRLSERIGRFAAKRVSAPEVTVTQAIAGAEQKTVYRNVALEDIADGRIARYSAGADFEFIIDVPNGEGSTKKKRAAGSIGAVTGEEIDAAYVARLYTEKAGPDDKEAKPLYGPFSIKDLAFSDGQSSFSYDEVRSSGFSIRMPAAPLLDTLDELKSVTNPDDLPPAERQAFFTRVLSIVDMIGKGDIEMLGLRIDAPAKDGTGDGDRIKLAIDRIGLQLDGRKLDGAVHGVAMGEGADYVKLGEASITGFSWGPTMEALTKLVGLDEQQRDTFPFTTLLPEFGTVRFAGLDVDLPNPDKDAGAIGAEESDAAQSATGGTDASASDVPSSEQTPGVDQADGAKQTTEAANSAVTSSAPERIRFTLKSYELALAKPYNGIPTDIRISYEDLSVPMPADVEDEAFTQLRQLGLDQLVFSSNTEAAWDEANQNLVIKDISLSGKDLGSFSLSGLMGGFTKQFFSGDKAMTQVALFGLTAREVKLKIEDNGLIAKGIKAYAEQNGMTEDDVRSTLAMTATAMLQQFAAAEPKLQNVADTFSSFIAKPGTFTLTLKSKAENGIGAFDLVAASQNPVLLLDKIDVEATAR
jgi:hypothetical protein